MKKTTVFIIITVLTLAVLLFIPKKKEHSIYIHDALGTVSEIKIYHKNDDALKECQSYIYRMDGLLSVTDEESEISRLNSGERIILSSETEDILKKALELSDDVAFNPFCGELIDVWERAKAENIPPSDDVISAAKEGIYPPRLNNEGEYWSLDGQKVNLGAIAKGYILDGIKKILNENQVESALVYLGGSIYAKGGNTEGEMWRIGIKDPDEEASYMGIISVKDKSVTTSGDYERYFEVDGIRYHHIIDPTTGYPAKSGLKSVTIISEDATLGDYLSTKCFVIGLEKSMDLIKNYNVSAIFITDKNEVFYSRDIEGNFTTLEDKYSYKTF